ncbi:MAG: hypothetical protein ACYC6L_09090 [Anaerolineae bacterium]
MEGAIPGYPLDLLRAQWTEVTRRMEKMAHDDSDPETWDVHHWQDINPVHTEALIQLTCGGPQIIYHGGLLHVRLRYFDLEARRPGLPLDTAALVEKLQGDSLVLYLANTSSIHPRSMLLQTGAFGEHSFSEVTNLSTGESAQAVNGKHLRVDLGPGAQLRLSIKMKRYVNQPSYTQPLSVD